MEKTITLSRQNGSWVATYSGEGSAQIRELFGTDTIPTPYMAGCSSIMVQTAISMRNADAVVVVSGKDS